MLCIFLVYTCPMCLSMPVLCMAGYVNCDLLVGRFCIGIYQGSVQATIRFYIGESSEGAIRMLPHEKQAKSTLKYTLYLIMFSVAMLSGAVGPGQ